MNLVLILISSLAMGLLLLRAIKFQGPWYELIALSFLLSVGLQTVVYFLIASKLNVVSPELYWKMVFFSSVLLGLINLFTSRQRESIQIAPPPRPQILISTIIWIGVFALFFLTLVYASYEPVYATDALTLYDFRAKVMYLTGEVYTISTIQNWTAYPMFTSIVHLFFWLAGFPNATIFYPFMYLAFALIFYSQLRRQLSSAFSSLGTLAMYSSPLLLWQSKIALNNLPYTIFYCCALFYAISGIKKDGIFSHMLISAIFLGLSAWTRQVEAFWLIPAILLFGWTIRHRSIRTIAIMLTYFVVFQSIRGIWPKYVLDPSLNINIARQSQSIINYVISQQTPSLVKYTATHSPINDPFQPPLVNIILVPLRGLLQSLKFSVPLIISSLAPSAYIFFPLLILELLFFRRLISLPLFSAIFGTFIIIWLGVFYSFVYLPYWETLDNALTRLSGLLIPLVWMYIFQSPIWSKLKLLH